MTSRTVLLRLDLGGKPFAFEAGQAVLAGVAGGGARKPYAIAIAPTLAARLQLVELLVQIDPLSPAPRLEDVSPGAAVEVEGPFGLFRLPPSTDGDAVLLVAGGTGIAPLRAMLWELLVSAHPTRAALVYSARCHDDLAFAEELAALAEAGRLDLHVTITREPDVASPWHRGRVDTRLLQRALPSRDAHCYICGPASFVDDMAAAIAALGVPPDRIACDV